LSLIKNLFYKAGDFQLNIPEWSFADQGITALTGASVSGKTTVLKILCGLLPCPKFSWKFQGQNLAQLSPPERQIGMCFQDLRLFPHWTARQNILFAIRARGYRPDNKNPEFEEVVHFLRIKHILNRSIDDLSGGEKQRVALARALIVQPRRLFLDEPFSYLDKKNKEKARHLTLNIVKKYSIPLLQVSHDKQDFKDLTREEFFLEQGQIHKL